MRYFLGFLVFLFLAYVGGTYFLSNLILHTPDRDFATVNALSIERWRHDIDSTLKTLPARTDVEIPAATPDQLLKGWYFRQPGDTATCAVIFAHGYSMNRADAVKYFPFFDRCGCDLLAYDHRGHGESYEAPATGGYREADDLLAVHAWLKDNYGFPDDRIGWWGESWGAATALQAAGRQVVNPAFVVAESPYADWYSAVTERGVKDYGTPLKILAPGAILWAELRNDMDFEDASTIAAARGIQVPVLLFHSLADDFTDPAQSDRIAAVIDPDLLTYHALDWGAWHAHNIISRREEYEGLVGEFVGDFCATRPTEAIYGDPLK